MLFLPCSGRATPRIRVALKSGWSRKMSCFNHSIAFYFYPTWHPPDYLPTVSVNSDTVVSCSTGRVFLIVYICKCIEKFIFSKPSKFYLFTNRQKHISVYTEIAPVSILDFAYDVDGPVVMSRQEQCIVSFIFVGTLLSSYSTQTS